MTYHIRRGCGGASSGSPFLTMYIALGWNVLKISLIRQIKSWKKHNICNSSILYLSDALLKPAGGQPAASGWSGRWPLRTARFPTIQSARRRQTICPSTPTSLLARDLRVMFPLSQPRTQARPSMPKRLKMSRRRFGTTIVAPRMKPGLTKSRLRRRRQAPSRTPSKAPSRLNRARTCSRRRRSSCAMRPKATSSGLSRASPRTSTSRMRTSVALWPRCIRACVRLPPRARSRRRTRSLATGSRPPRRARRSRGSRGA